MNNDADFFIELVKHPRIIDLLAEGNNRQVNDSLENLYLEKKRQPITRDMSLTNRLYELEYLESKCSFVKHCWEDAKNITEIEWFILGSIFSEFGGIGNAKFHEYSKRDAARYNPTEADKKLVRNKKYCYSCNKIKQIYNCEKDCGLKLPLDWITKDKKKDPELEKYQMIDNWLVYIDDKKEPPVYTRICSPIYVKARARTGNSTLWSYLIEVIDPRGDKHVCLVPFWEINTGKDDAVKSLSSSGIVVCGKKANEMMKKYIILSIPDKWATICDKNGWIGIDGTSPLKYLPFDIGEQKDGSDYLCLKFPSMELPYQKKGSLREC